jgi:hypothetical protein
MKKIVLILLCVGLIQPLQADETAVLTVTVMDLYRDYIDNARVSVSYVFSQDEQPFATILRYAGLYLMQSFEK